jgi:aryl carrier-like protein
VANSTVHVLDAHGALQPAGVPGEICTGGDGLAEGYLGRPELSAERFVPHPFEAGARLYRTGDRGYWDFQGRLVFAGRLDEQLKVRGFRVEPGEVAQAMKTHEAVSEAVVVARPTSAGTLELVGYYTAEGALEADALKRHLALSLPEFMVPARLMQLPAFPLNASLKIDRAALPDPAPLYSELRAWAPQGDAQGILAELWLPLLDVPPDASAHFFGQGGDSIRAIQLVSRLRQRGWLLEVRDVFEQPALSDMAQRMRPLQAQALPAAAQAMAGPVPLSPVQHWFFEHHEGPLHHFNQSLLLQPRQHLDEAALAQTMRALAARHEALRLRFARLGGTWQAEIVAEDEPWLESRAWPSNDASAQAALLDGLQAQFDLGRRPLWRAVILRSPREGGDRLWLAAHHLVVDGVSWRVLLDDLEVSACRMNQ